MFKLTHANLHAETVHKKTFFSLLATWSRQRANVTAQLHQDISLNKAHLSSPDLAKQPLRYDWHGDAGFLLTGCTEVFKITRPFGL